MYLSPDITGDPGRRPTDRPRGRPPPASALARRRSVGPRPAAPAPSRLPVPTVRTTAATPAGPPDAAATTSHGVPGGAGSSREPPPVAGGGSRTLRGCSSLGRAAARSWSAGPPSSTGSTRARRRPIPPRPPTSPSSPARPASARPGSSASCSSGSPAACPCSPARPIPARSAAPSSCCSTPSTAVDLDDDALRRRSPTAAARSRTASTDGIGARPPGDRWPPGAARVRGPALGRLREPHAVRAPRRARLRPARARRHLPARRRAPPPPRQRAAAAPRAPPHRHPRPPRPAVARSTSAPSSTAVYGRAPSYRVVEALHTRTGGNPFFLEELLGAAGDTIDPEQLVDLRLPWSLAELMRGQLDELEPEPSAASLEAAAVLGQRVAFDLLAAVTGTSEDELIERPPRRSSAAGLLLEEEHDVFTFRHALAREAVERRAARPGEAAAAPRRPRRAVRAERAATSPPSPTTPPAPATTSASSTPPAGAARSTSTQGSTYQALQLAELGLAEADDDPQLLRGRRPRRVARRADPRRRRPQPPPPRGRPAHRRPRGRVGGAAPPGPPRVGAGRHRRDGRGRPTRSIALLDRLPEGHERGMAMAVARPVDDAPRRRRRRRRRGPTAPSPIADAPRRRRRPRPRRWSRRARRSS